MICGPRRPLRPSFAIFAGLASTSRRFLLIQARKGAEDGKTTLTSADPAVQGATRNKLTEMASDVHRAAKIAKGATRIRAPAHAIDPSDAPRPCHQRPAPRPRPQSIAQIGCRQRFQGPQRIETAADSASPQLAPELYNLRRNLPASEGECRVGHEHLGAQQQ